MLSGKSILERSKRRQYAPPRISRSTSLYQRCTAVLLLTMQWVAPQAVQANQWYEVDLVIYEDQSNSWAVSENWRPPSQTPKEIPESARLFEELAYTDTLEFQNIQGLTEDRSRMVGALNLRKQYRILFSESWQQTIPAKSRVTPYYIRGGQAIRERNELEGTIALYVGRYLHLKLDLKLHQFMAKEAAIQQGLFQPPMPSDADLALYHQTGLEYNELNTDTNSSHILDARSIGRSADASSNSQTYDHPSYNRSPQAGMEGYYSDSDGLENRQDEYVTVRSIPITQSRRMRSNETHYIDHPLMGVLVKVKKIEITPLEYSTDHSIDSSIDDSLDYSPDSSLDSSNNPSRNPSRNSANPSGNKQSDQNQQVLDAPWE